MLRAGCVDALRVCDEPKRRPLPVQAINPGRDVPCEARTGRPWPSRSSRSAGIPSKCSMVCARSCGVVGCSLGLCAQQRQQLADLNARRARGNRFQFAANFGRRCGLHVPQIELRRPSAQKHQNAALCPPERIRIPGQRGRLRRVVRSSDAKERPTPPNAPSLSISRRWNRRSRRGAGSVIPNIVWLISELRTRHARKLQLHRSHAVLAHGRLGPLGIAGFHGLDQMDVLMLGPLDGASQHAAARAYAPVDSTLAPRPGPPRPRARRFASETQSPGHEFALARRANRCGDPIPKQASAARQVVRRMRAARIAGPLRTRWQCATRADCATRRP